jgi:hypothetical protein
MTQSYLKAAIDGVNGSGKSGTSARLAVGLSKEFCGSAPVLAFDSEERWRFYKRTIFDVENVPLMRVSGTSLPRLQEALKRTEQEGACVFVGDQLTTPWKEGLKEFSYEDGYLPFERRQQLMNQWYPIIQQFRYGKFHAICAGRLGYEWENLEDDRGRMRLTQGDSKFNAGGGENFGYEADLELEMHRNKRRLLGLIRGKTSAEYICEVVKDATGGVLNGQQFVFPGQGLYKAGDYKAVLNAFRPYVEFMREVEAPTQDTTSARDLVITGKTAWANDQDEKKWLLEDLAGLFSYCFGSERSSQGKMFTNLTLEAFGYGWSWSRMESAPTPELESRRDLMQAVRRRVDRKELPTDQPSLLRLLQLAHEDLKDPNNFDVTLFQAMQADYPVNGKRGPQVVKEQQAEVAGD